MNRALHTFWACCGVDRSIEIEKNIIPDGRSTQRLLSAAVEKARDTRAAWAAMRDIRAGRRHPRDAFASVEPRGQNLVDSAID